MVLLDTRGSNPKLFKTAAAGYAPGTHENASRRPIRMAGLSLYPDAVLCPSSKAAGCMADCLKNQGRGRFDSVTDSRQAKADWLYSDPVAFLTQLKGELENFRDTVARADMLGVVRLNVLSDIDWENYGVPQAFERDLFFLDYTKRADRLCKTPDNYRLIFSYSGRASFARQNAVALATGLPVAVVFRGGFPAHFLGRPVLDGDRSDYLNATRGTGHVVGLRAKGSAVADRSGFVVDNPELIGCAA